MEVTPRPDDVMRLGMNHPMGPLTLIDLTDLIPLTIMEVLYEGLVIPNTSLPIIENMLQQDG